MSKKKSNSLLIASISTHPLTTNKKTRTATLEDCTTNFSSTTIKRIYQAVRLTVGGGDWLTRKQLLEGLNFAGLQISNAQLYKDIELLKECNISGFNYFKYDKGFDKSSATIVVAFRWLAHNRSRGQAIIHLPEVIKLIGGLDVEQQRCHHSAIEVKAVQL